MLEGGGLEQRLMELSPLEVAHLGQRWVADDLPDAVAEFRARTQPAAGTTPGRRSYVTDRTGMWAAREAFSGIAATHSTWRSS